MDYLVTPRQTLTAARRARHDQEELQLPGVALMTFSRGVVERVGELCVLDDVAWISSRDHPYAAPRLVRRGHFDGLGVTVLIPPMGASPLACIIEDLVACGAQAIFLVCAAWSLGPPVRFGDLIVLSFSLGSDGTSLHYGNPHGEIRAPTPVVTALAETCHSQRVPFHVGGNATCEALYRITPVMVEAYRRRQCLCMENGEANTLLAVTSALGVLGGVLFQPYIDLTLGWHPERLEDRLYRGTCRRQAEIVLEASARLRRQQHF